MRADLTTNSGSSNEKAPADRMRAHVGVVCSQALEVRRLLGQLDRRRGYADGGTKFTGGFLQQSLRVAVVESGSGFAAHRRATQTLVREHAPRWIVSAGFSSSLAEDVHAGDLCLATSLLDTHGQELVVKCPIPESQHTTRRPHLVADRHPETAAEKQQLAKEYAVAAVDTSSLAVAQICESSQTPFLSIRAIVDDFSEHVPTDAVNVVFNPEGGTRHGMAGRWVARWRQSAETRQWNARARTSGERLSQFLLGVIEQLGEHAERSS